MPATYSAQVFKSPETFLDSCSAPLLATRDAAANLALASTYRLATHDPDQARKEHTWLSLTTRDVINPDPPMFTLTAIAPYPVVLAVSVDPARLDKAEREAAMARLSSELAATGFSTKQLSAVVGPRALAEPFADAWATLQGLKRKDKPLVHMYLSFATPDTLRAPTQARSGLQVSPAHERDLDELAHMFEAFTAVGAHPMSESAAREYAASLIKCGELYSCMAEGVLSGLATATRPTPGARAISTVWTNENARGKGVAEALVREVCKSVFASGVAKVCLFVQPTNPIAARVYGRVGFVGLETGVPGQNTEEWIELGFEDVEQGDWV